MARRNGKAGASSSGFDWGKATTIALAVTAVSGAVVAVSGGIPRLISAFTGGGAAHETARSSPARVDIKSKASRATQSVDETAPPETGPVVETWYPDGRRQRSRCARGQNIENGNCVWPRTAVVATPDCPPGWGRDGNGICQAPERPPPETRQCPDGSVIPVAQQCPGIEYAQSLITAFNRDHAAPETRQCPDGSIIPANQQCPLIVEPRTGPFIVFFDLDKAAITPAAAAILDNVALIYQQYASLGVALTGHADRSGSDDHNVALSQRRANAVRAHLARRGVPDAAIISRADGESHPLVDTADGVREPQNRRVEITFGPGSGW